MSVFYFNSFYFRSTFIKLLVTYTIQSVINPLSKHPHKHLLDSLVTTATRRFTGVGALPGHLRSAVLIQCQLPNSTGRHEQWPTRIRAYKCHFEKIAPKIRPSLIRWRPALTQMAPTYARHSTLGVTSYKRYENHLPYG